MKKSLAEMVEAARFSKFDLPPDITMSKELLSNNRWAYVFRHLEMGNLGRILLLPHSSGQTQITCEVSGDPDDPMTIKRREILEPISMSIVSKMTEICGDGVGVVEAYNSPKEACCVQCVIHPCDNCGKPAALLVFAEEANNNGELEDYARMMHSKIKELAVPTWIIGEEHENIVNGEDLRKSLVLKIYPTREEARTMTPDDVMDSVELLTSRHC